jgi:hypothetical protein
MHQDDVMQGAVLFHVFRDLDKLNQAIVASEARMPAERRSVLESR